MGAPNVQPQTDEPIKPGLPLLLVGALLFWVACAGTYGTCCGCTIELLARAAAVAAALFVVALVACAFRRTRIAGACALALVLGVLFGLAGAFQMHVDEGTVGHEATWRLTLTSDPVEGDYGWSAFADAVAEDGMHGRFQVRFSDEIDLLRGDMLDVRGTPRVLSEESRAFSWSQGVCATLSVASFEPVAPPVPLAQILQMRRTAIDAFAAHGGDRAGLLQALACGYRPTMNASGAYEAFKTCGLAHLVAVSGAHLALVVGLFDALLRAMRMPRRIVMIVTIALISAYLVFAGIPISAVRAACMVVLALLSSVAKRRSASLNALALCIIGIIAVDPTTAVSASFVLSAGSTLGILLFAGRIASWFAFQHARLRDLVAAPLGMTLASNIATLPYSAALFSQLPFIAPVANVIAAPLFVLACTMSLLSALIACAVPAAAGLICMIGALAVTPLSVAVNAMAQVPYACIALSVPMLPAIALSVMLTIILWFWWPRFAGRQVAGGIGAMVVLICAGLWIAPHLAGDQLVMLDVGQGDAFLVRSQGRAILIDTGNQDALLRENLGRLGITRLDAVVVSHHDDDHCGSLPSLASYVQIGAVYTAADALLCPCDGCERLREDVRSACGSSLEGLAVGSTLQVGRFMFTIIWPDRFAEEGGNADSVCLLAQLDCDGDGACDWRTVFLGDAEQDELERMMDAGRLGAVDVLKVGHHGSKVSLNESLADRLDPNIALISCGRNNRYGHPTDEALSCLDDAEQVLRSDQMGTMALDFSKEGIAVHSS